MSAQDNLRTEVFGFLAEFGRGLAQDEQGMIDGADGLLLSGERGEVHSLRETLDPVDVFEDISKRQTLGS